jgi:hypothetical protein
MRHVITISSPSVTLCFLEQRPQNFQKYLKQFGVVLGSGRKTTSLRDAENLSSARVSPAPLPLSEDSRTSAQQHRQLAEAPSMRFELRADTGKEPYFRSTTLMA